jgi:peptidoglycan hydrolase CwlO-like protein
LEDQNRQAAAHRSRIERDISDIERDEQSMRKEAEDLKRRADASSNEIQRLQAEVEIFGPWA